MKSKLIWLKRLFRSEPSCDWCGRSLESDDQGYGHPDGGSGRFCSECYDAERPEKKDSA